MKKTPTKPLKLSTETIRQLDGVKLVQVAGGWLPTTRCRDAGPISDGRCLIEGA